MNSSRNIFLISGAICSLVAAIFHLGCIVFGGDWYRFMGAGEQMAQMAEAGDAQPTIVTSVIVLILMNWSLYGLSGARVIAKLPLIRTGLIVISTIYLLRGLLFFALMPAFPDNSLTFWLVSSLICLCIGLLYAIGTYQTWQSLTLKSG